MGGHGRRWHELGERRGRRGFSNRARAAVAAPVLIAALALGLTVGAGSAAAGGVNISGDWSTTGTGGWGPQNFVITDNGGTLSGEGVIPGPGAQEFATLSGSVSGNNVQFTLTYTMDVGYVSTQIGTIGTTGKTMSGNWTSTVSGQPTGQSGTWSAQLGLASATAVNCDDFNTDQPNEYFQCTATVGDASGEATPQTPTGTVTFTVNPGAGGGFQSNSTCQLGPSQSGPTAFCAVNYVPPAPGAIPIGSQPAITAAYSGDSVFAPSTGQPQNEVGTCGSDDPQECTTTQTTALTTATTSQSTTESTTSQSTTESTSSTSSTSETTTMTTTTENSLSSCAVPASSLEARPAAGLGNVAQDFDPVAPGPPLAALASSGPREVVVGATEAKSRARVLTLRQADRRALALLKPATAPLSGGVEIYGLAKPLKAGSVINEDELGFGRALLPPLKVKVKAWLYWEDLAPGTEFTHPSVVLLLAARGGKLLARASFITYPQVNGTVAAFITARHPHVVYLRVPAFGAHPLHVTAAQLRKIKTADNLVATIKKSRLAHPSDVNTSALITLVSSVPIHDSDTFANEQAAITNVFASHGISTQNTTDVAGLSNAVDSAAAAGKTQVTIYLDGHGASAASWAQPAILLGDVPQTSAEFQANSVQADQLATIVQAHPDVQFNFIIDSCYSGRFVDPLSAEPNVASVTTSSNSTQQSKGPEVLETDTPAGTDTGQGRGLVLTQNTSNPAPGEISVPVGGTLQTPSGQQLTVAPAGDYTNAISPFTGAEVAALNQAFIGQGATADVTAAIKDARTLEPTYDLAAIAGQTSPSPDPTPNPACVPADTPEPTQTGGWFTGTGATSGPTDDD